MMVANAVDLHAAATQGRLEDLVAGLRKKDAAGQLEAGTACRAPPNSPCTLSPALDRAV